MNARQQSGGRESRESRDSKVALERIGDDCQAAPTFGRPKPRIGLFEWFRIGEHDRVQSVLSALKALGVQELRTTVSWADWVSDGGEEWYGWLLPMLARQVNVLPCFVYTPPSLAVVPKTSAPPRDPKWYADFLDQMITLFGDHFEWMELWNDPNSGRLWDRTLDPDWSIFAKMIGGAAHWARKRGKKTVLGGSAAMDPAFVAIICERGVMKHVDAVGIHGFPATFQFDWEGWAAGVGAVRELLSKHGSRAEIWITETGYSTWKHDERNQVASFLDAVEAPAERVYWHSVQDLVPQEDATNGNTDDRRCHFGLKRGDGSEKLLYRLWAKGGVDAVRHAAWLTAPAHIEPAEQPVLITGGAGFIGTNLAHRLLSEGRPVTIFDNLSRPGVERNLQWLHDTHGRLAEIEFADVRDAAALAAAVRRASQVFHFAAQVAVTTSLTNPAHDFDVNGRGTLNLLEAIRSADSPPPLVFTSTNKVYGGLEDVPLTLDRLRYEPVDGVTRALGVSEARALDFHSPYGCSKGTADQYVLDYARTFGLPAVVFRMSCIYGPHQFGTEDQGWVAHFLIRALDGRPRWKPRRSRRRCAPRGRADPYRFTSTFPRSGSSRAPAASAALRKAATSLSKKRLTSARTSLVAFSAWRRYSRWVGLGGAMEERV
jgi:CDP-paratose 2-epimerase